MKSLTKSLFRHAVPMGVALVVAGVGCQPADDRTDRWDDDEARAAMTVQVDLMRSDVNVILDSLRAEIDDLRAGAQDEPLERWTDVAAQVEETRGEVLRDVDEVDVADSGEARRVRDRAADRIAELEAEVARAELEFAADRQVLRARTDQRLTELENNLAELATLVSTAERLRGATPGDRPADPERRAAADIDLDTSELRDLQEELVEAQQLAAERVPDQDRDLDDVRDELSGHVADLTRDIRKHWHAVRWSGHTP